MTIEQIIERSKQHVRAAGCVCDVWVNVVSVLNGVPQVTVAHDDWCPLLRVYQESPGNGDYPGVVHSETVSAEDAA